MTKWGDTKQSLIEQNVGGFNLNILKPNILILVDKDIAQNIAQKCLSVRGDWTELVEAEKAKYGISESDSEIAEMSREKFKSKIQKKIEAHAVRCLNNIAENHSKSEQIVDYDFKRKAYFTDRRFSKTDVQLLFALRTKMLDCKTNFQNQYAEDLSCRFCKDNGNIEDEDHILRCTVLNNEKYDVKFSDVYGNIDHQYKAVQRAGLRSPSMVTTSLLHRPTSM